VEGDNPVQNLVAEDMAEAHRAAAAEVDPNALPWSAWGSLVWRESPVPEGEAHNAPTTYFVTIRLRRNDDPALTTLHRGKFLGDSELRMEGAAIERSFMLPARDPVGVVHVELLDNAQGRLGSIVIGIDACPNAFTAYLVSQTVFNTVAVAAGIQCGIPLRWASALIVRHEPFAPRAARQSILAYAGYPEVVANLSFALSPAVSRLQSSYVEGLRSNSPFYSFLCFFALAEYMTGRLQGRLRTCAHGRNIDYDDLKGTLTAESVGRVAPTFIGTTYDELLKAARPLRNAVAHFIITRCPRPFNAADEDRASFAREALKVACRALLTKVQANYDRLLGSGMTHDELMGVFEGQ
jgi:hypothetical protein